MNLFSAHPYIHVFQDKNLPFDIGSYGEQILDTLSSRTDRELIVQELHLVVRLLVADQSMRLQQNSLRQLVNICLLQFHNLVQPRCHTRFSKEQNQANHMCAQEVHTYVRMKKYQKQCYYITYTVTP
jgi:hypothetical protein